MAQKATSITSRVEEKDLEFSKDSVPVVHGDEEFGGTEERTKLERKLLRKLDLRMSILIVIYILNYVCVTPRLLRISRANCLR